MCCMRSEVMEVWRGRAKAERQSRRSLAIKNALSLQGGDCKMGTRLFTIPAGYSQANQSRRGKAKRRCPHPFSIFVNRDSAPLVSPHLPPLSLLN